MKKILVIEDEPLVARMYQKALTFNGFTVTSAIGGKEGIDKARKEKPDIVLCDVMMPEPNGVEVLETLKKDPETKKIPIIMLTNLSGKHDSELAMSKGATDYWVKKDSDPKDLAERIEKIVGKASEEKAVEETSKTS